MGEAPARETILIVEDEALVASSIRQVLEESGFIVLGVASSGAEAMALAGTRIPDLALVDIRIAGPIDGIEVAMRMRREYNVPAIFLSGIQDPDVTERARRAAPLGFLNKPFRPSQVYNAIHDALERLKAAKPR